MPSLFGTPAVDSLSEFIVDRVNAGIVPATLVTWLNHWSALRHVLQPNYDELLANFDVVGIDGIGLLRLLREPVAARTSADLVLPRVFTALTAARIALIGGTDATQGLIKAKVRDALPSTAAIVYSSNGYDELRSARNSGWHQLTASQPSLTIVGLGAVLQEEVAYEISQAAVRGVVVTSGGFFDQFARGTVYYPRWAYPLRLNWLVRLVREPRRLWRRYSLDALHVIWHRRKVCHLMQNLPGLKTFNQIAASGRNAE